MLGIAAPKAPGPKYGQPVAPNLAVRHICPNCKTDPPNIIEEFGKGDLVCGDCGTILGDRVVDTRSEWRTFAGDEGDDPSRVGGPGNALLGNAPLETTISFRDGKSGMSQALLRAANRGNLQSNGVNGKTPIAVINAMFSKIGELCDTMQLGKEVANMARHAYKMADERKALRGKNERAVIAACIIYATRTGNAARSFQEVCRVTKVSKKELGHVFVLVKAAVQASLAESGGLGSQNSHINGQSKSQESAAGMLGRFVNYMDLGQPVANAAKYIAGMAVEKSTIDGRSPVSIAGGVLFFTCVLFEKSVSAKDIQDVAKVSDSTIKLICKMIALKLDDVIKPEWKTEHPAGYSALAALGRVNDAASRASRTGTPNVSTPTATPVVATPTDGVTNGIASNGNGLIQ